MTRTTPSKFTVGVIATTLTVIVLVGVLQGGFEGVTPRVEAIKLPWRRVFLESVAISLVVLVGHLGVERWV